MDFPKSPIVRFMKGNTATPPSFASGISQAWNIKLLLPNHLLSSATDRSPTWLGALSRKGTALGLGCTACLRPSLCLAKKNGDHEVPPGAFLDILFLFISSLLPRARGITSCWCLRQRLRSLGACWLLPILLCGSKDVISRQNFAGNLELLNQIFLYLAFKIVVAL
jgi:hypothetical protein